MTIDRKTLIEKHIRTFLTEECGVDEHMIVPQSRLREDLGLDNVEAICFVSDLEETFSFDLENHEVDAILTVQQAIDVVTKHTEPANE